MNNNYLTILLALLSIFIVKKIISNTIITVNLQN